MPCHAAYIHVFAALATGLILFASTDTARAQNSVHQATLVEPNQKTPEVSTEEVRRILADGSAVLIDSRKRSEYVAGHIAGAKSAMLEPGSPPDASVAAVSRLVDGDKTKPLVLYCNGPHCQASRQLGEQLVAAGFTNVRRYQLGLPMWRTLSGAVEIELEGILRIYRIDQTAVFLDARSEEEFSKRRLPGAHNVPADKLATDGLRKAPMPNNDFNTRIVLFGRDGTQARALADAIGKTPYQNVSYFPGIFEELAAATKVD
ncbi:MAG TPA: rhodanese-like domain-containing protein [Xanthobacteraceae bacterium]|nr:rhodanese-like domain-containing protein [Xanthobacteraceae bacterium]